MPASPLGSSRLGSKYAPVSTSPSDTPLASRSLASAPSSFAFPASSVVPSSTSTPSATSVSTFPSDSIFTLPSVIAAPSPTFTRPPARSLAYSSDGDIPGLPQSSASICSASPSPPLSPLLPEQSSCNSSFALLPSSPSRGTSVSTSVLRSPPPTCVALPHIARATSPRCHLPTSISTTVLRPGPSGALLAAASKSPCHELAPSESLSAPRSTPLPPSGSTLAPLASSGTSSAPRPDPVAISPPSEPTASKSAQIPPPLCTPYGQIVAALRTQELDNIKYALPSLSIPASPPPSLPLSTTSPPIDGHRFADDHPVPVATRVTTSVDVALSRVRAALHQLRRNRIDEAFDPGRSPTTDYTSILARGGDRLRSAPLSDCRNPPLSRSLDSAVLAMDRVSVQWAIARSRLFHSTCRSSSSRPKLALSDLTMDAAFLLASHPRRRKTIRLLFRQRRLRLASPGSSRLSSPLSRLKLQGIIFHYAAVPPCRP
ncbi:hypothetical protein CF326_g9398 [Tilletia indica]|nr:hypothetical protein CF326_g9398 [Tilletia indica]